MTDSKRQSLIMIGVGLLLLAGIMLYFALSQPKELIVNKSTVNNSQSYDSYQNEINSTQNDITQNSTLNYETDTNTEDLSSAAYVSYPLNLNSCTAEELQTIDGIGSVKAQNIIEYRNHLGGYTSVEQIKNISGIGDKIYAKIAPYLTV